MSYGKIKAKVLYYFLRRRAANHPPNKPSRALVEDLLKIVNPSLMAGYKPSEHGSLQLTVPWIYSDSYAGKLKGFNDVMATGEPVPVTSVADNNIVLLLEQFLSTSEGHYADPVQTAEDIKREGLRLCKLLEKSDTAEMGVDEHNLRMLHRTLISLRTVADAFCRVATS